MKRLPVNASEVMAISHVLLNDAHVKYRNTRNCQLVALVVGAIAIFAPGRFSLVLAILVLTLQALAFYLRHAAQVTQASGDELRRRGLMLDAFSGPYQDSAVTGILSRIGKGVRDRAQTEAISDYFASQLLPGPRRLVENVCENLFWNQALYRRAASRGNAVLITSAILLALATLLSVALSSPDLTLAATRISVALVAFLVGFTYISDVNAWRTAARTLATIEPQLEALGRNSDSRLRNNGLGELMALFSEYTVATSKIPPIPRKLYRVHRDELNRLWAEKQARRLTS